MVEVVISGDVIVGTPTLESTGTDDGETTVVDSMPAEDELDETTSAGVVGMGTPMVATEDDDSIFCTGGWQSKSILVMPISQAPLSCSEADSLKVTL